MSLEDRARERVEQHCAEQEARAKEMAASKEAAKRALVELVELAKKYAIASVTLYKECFRDQALTRKEQKHLGIDETSIRVRYLEQVAEVWFLSPRSPKAPNHYYDNESFHYVIDANGLAYRCIVKAVDGVELVFMAAVCEFSMDDLLRQRIEAAAFRIVTGKY